MFSPYTRYTRKSKLNLKGSKRFNRRFMTWLVRIRRKEKLHKKQKSCFKHHHYRIIIQQVMLYQKNEKALLIRRAMMCPRGQYPWNKTRCTWLKTVYLNNILLKPLFLWLHTLTSSKTSIEFQYNEALIDVFHEWSTSIRPLNGQVIDNLTKKLIKSYNIFHDKYNF